jgi:hypothetical protein
MLASVFAYLSISNVFYAVFPLINFFFDFLFFADISIKLCSDCGCRYWDITDGRRLDASECADLQVPDWTSLLGWPVQGVFYAGSDGTDVNAVSVAPNKSAVVAGDDDSCVRLYRYPCLFKAEDKVRVASTWRIAFSHRSLVVLKL